MEIVNTHDFLVRIIFCFLLSVLVGIERQYHHRITGLRTNVLVGIGAFLFVYLSFAINPVNVDRTRMASQVISGIGFLGAGVILRDGSKIKGLNTAATLWCVSAIGVLTASGFIKEASIGTLFVLISNILLRHISKYLMEKGKFENKEKCTINISCSKHKEKLIRTLLKETLDLHRLSLASMEKEEVKINEVLLKASVITTRKEVIEDIVKNISTDPGVISISWSHKKFFQPDSIDYDEEVL